MSSRVDAWEVRKHREYTPVSCGYSSGFEEKYEVGDVLGRGGFGVVRVVSKKKNGKQYAAKSIKKVLEVPNLSIERQAAHLANIKREISVLYRLRGTLNIVHFKEALEDDEYVHIVMELCRGGELSHSLAERHYSERTVCSYMRAVLRTLAQCHSHRILHRDIKPGNFMLLDTDQRSPLKAIDFGLAVFYDANKLPRTDLGLEGTPWFLAPENLSSEFYPASDLWSAGVMAYQLLSGYLPFDDRRNRHNPALSQVWKAILTEEPNFNISAFKDVSEEAKSFISMLLQKDHSLRPSAKDALNHAWLAGGDSADRAKGAPLQQTVVQRIQRFNQGNALKRTIFELIAQELLPTLVPDTSAHGPALSSMELASLKPEAVGVMTSHKRPLDSTRARDSTHAAFQGPGGGAIEGPPLLGRISAGSAHGGLEYYRARGESVHGAANAMLHDRHGRSVHGGRNYWRILRAAATAAKWHSRSVHGTHDYVRWVGRTDEERAEQRKAARLCLDTSAHAGSEYRRLVHVLSNAALDRMDSEPDGQAEPPRWMPLHNVQDTVSGPLTDIAEDPDTVMQEQQSMPSSPPPSLPRIPETSEPPSAKLLSEGEEGRRGQHFYKHFVEATGGKLTQEDAIKAKEHLQGASPGRNMPHTAMQEQLESPFQRSRRPTGSPGPASPLKVERGAAAEGPTRRSSERRKVSFSTDSKGSPDNADPAGESADSQGRAISLQELREVMKRMNYTREAEAVTEAELAQGLASLGFRLEASETRALVEKMDEHKSGAVRKSAFVASQLDWPAIQTDYREQWLAAAHKVFEGLDGANGLTIQRLMTVLREKLPAAEVEYAVEDALVEAGYKDEEEIDFEGFIKILRAGSTDSLDNLDQYDARLSNHLSPRAGSVCDDSGHSRS
ncbi:probable calcium-dependent protein kinase 17 at N-terminal half [Coccomyxa sp. Obi]|nr:probable calcium-dependent protein kinase 17 at N-terminal half [Coccomyxa sp. Obi]